VKTKTNKMLPLPCFATTLDRGTTNLGGLSAATASSSRGRSLRIVLARPLLGLGALQIPERIRVHDRTRVDERDGRERQSCRRVTLASRIAGDGGVGAGVIGLCAIHLVEFDYWEKTCIIHCPGKSKRLFKRNLTRTFLVAFKCE